VANVVDIRTVMLSRTIHKRGFPRDLAAGFADDCWADSVDEDLSVDNPCQNCSIVNTLLGSGPTIKRSDVFR
jgi:hypothetical protein